ncbi:GBP7, partial [Symbiodinium sp. KB8]
LELQEEGLTVLRRVGSPLHVAFAIGGSRCGKSTACNALLLGADAGDRSCFETGSAFDPVTIGVDVAARRLPGGGALVLADCEGAFHLCGSTLNARGFGDVGFLAYHLSSTVIHVSMGSIDERDLEALGHLATDAAELRCDAPECLRPDASPPELLLLVNG